MKIVTLDKIDICREVLAAGKDCTARLEKIIRAKVNSDYFVGSYLIPWPREDGEVLEMTVYTKGANESMTVDVNPLALCDMVTFNKEAKRIVAELLGQGEKEEREELARLAAKYCEPTRGLCFKEEDHG